MLWEGKNYKPFNQAMAKQMPRLAYWIKRVLLLFSSHAVESNSCFGKKIKMVTRHWLWESDTNSPNNPLK